MKKFLNALDRIVGLAFFAVFAVIAILAWRYASPSGIFLQNVHGHDGYKVLAGFVFIIVVAIDFTMLYQYWHALSCNKFKFTNVLKHMLKLPRISFVTIYNWFTAD